MESTKETRERLAKVLDSLKKKGKTQAKIADDLDINADNISGYKKGKTKEIPDSFLNGLQEQYHINPDYIQGTSQFMYDIPGFRLQNFEKVVDSWDTVELPVRLDDGTKEIEKFIHLTMDKNFYSFLIEAERVHELASEGIVDECKKRHELSTLYSGEPDAQEYVLISRNTFLEMAEEHKRKKMMLEEVLDFNKFDIDETE